VMGVLGWKVDCQYMSLAIFRLGLDDVGIGGLGDDGDQLGLLE